MGFRSRSSGPSLAPRECLYNIPEPVHKDTPTHFTSVNLDGMFLLFLLCFIRCTSCYGVCLILELFIVDNFDL